MKPFNSQTVKRQVEDGVHKDHPGVGVVQAYLAVHQENRDGDHHRGQHAPAQNEKEQVVGAGHLKAAESVGGKQTKGYRGQRRPKSDDY